MSKFDPIRKKVKKKKNEIHFVYIILFIVSITIVGFYINYKTNTYERELENIIQNYQEKSLTLGETLFTTLKSNEKYKHYFNSLPFGNPLDTIIIESVYGWRKHPINGIIKFHKGVDLQSKKDNLVFTSGDGEVIFCGWKQGYGKTIMIKHKLDYITLYAHLNNIIIKEGDIVNKGDMIAMSGNTGKSTGPHLHYEIRINNKSVDPVDYLELNTNFSDF